MPQGKLLYLSIPKSHAQFDLATAISGNYYWHILMCLYGLYGGGFLRALAQRSSKPCAADLFPHTCNRAHACFSPRFISGIFSALIDSSGFIYAINLRSQQTHCAIVVDRPEHAHARQFCLPLLASIPMPIFAYVYQAPLLLCPAMVTDILIRLRITFKLHEFSFSQSSMFSF